MVLIAGFPIGSLPMHPISAQEPAAGWRLLKVQRVPVSHADSARYWESLKAQRESSLLLVEPVATGALSVRYTVDNPCGEHIRLRVRERSKRTLTIDRVRESLPYARGCPAAIRLESYVGRVVGLRHGTWHIVASERPEVRTATDVEIQ